MKFKVRIDPTQGQSQEKEVEAPPSGCSVEDICKAGGIDPKNMDITVNGAPATLQTHVTPADALAARDRNAPTVVVSERPRGS